MCRASLSLCTTVYPCATPFPVFLSCTGVSGIAFPALLTEAAGVCILHPSAPSARMETITNARLTCAFDPGEGSATQYAALLPSSSSAPATSTHARAVARMTSVIRSVWEVVRSQDDMRGCHVLVAPSAADAPGAGTAASAAGSFNTSATPGSKVGSEHVQMLQAVQGILRDVCYAEPCS